MVLGLAGEKVSLLDSNAQALAAASTAHQQIGLSPECVLGDIFEKSRELGGRFDVVASFGVLEHFSGEGRLSALRAMSGFLRPGGMLFFTVPNRLSPFYRIAFGLRRLSGSVPKDLYEMPYSRSELVLLASSSGIDVLTVEGVNTLSDDLGYWIWGNAVSVARRMAGIKGSAPRADDRAGLKRPDLSGSSITDARGRLDKLYSSDLLFVGVKK
jgi:2-polyprenyl-3-methyl-5-hydroxy-6-metoxy-1,4-benzoquinol methylase